MATVFLAHDVKHDRSVAVKVLHPEVAGALGADRFLREIRIAAHLQHPHILTLIDSGEIPRQDHMGPSVLYYVMPYVEGESLRERLTREGRLTPSDTARMLQEVLDALTHAHGLGIVHRDIKPENIMLSGRHALVMDFGVAKAASAAAASGSAASGTLTALGLAIGTPNYMAPEQAAGMAAVDARTDLYAVGVMAYEMLTGQTPFTGTTPQAILAAHVTQMPPPIAARRPDLAAPFASAVMRCLEKEPAARWRSAEELRAHVEAFATPGSGVTAAAGGGGGGAVRRRSAALLAAAIVALGILGAGTWLGPGRRARARQRVREQAIPQLLALAELGQWDSAYTLARRVEAANPHDSLFRALRPRFARRVNLHTNPPGATVWRKEYAAPDSAWMLLGKTPLDSALLSPTMCFGVLCLSANRVRVELQGYRTLDLVGIRFG